MRSDKLDVDAISARGMCWDPLCWGSAMGLEALTQLRASANRVIQSKPL